MVVITTKVEGKDKPLYMDGGLYQQLNDRVKPSVQKKDFDWFVVVDGQEGAGKSVFGFQLAKVLDPNFSNEQIAFTANDFIRLVVKAKKYQCIVFDEAFTGLSSRTSLSEINNILVSLMMEMRQKNLFIILIMPSFFMLDKYCVLHRAKGLFHVYMRDGKRGYWNFYNKRSMKMLYLTGKKYYEYTGTKPVMFGRFQDQYTINESEYRIVKKEALHKKKRQTKAESYKLQRDLLLFGLYNDFFNKNKSKLTQQVGKWNVDLQRSSIRDIIYLMEQSLSAKIKDIKDEMQTTMEMSVENQEN